MAKKQRFPNLGKLSISILETWVKPLIGEEAIDIIKEPVKEKELRDALVVALQETEKRFIEEHRDTEVGEAILELPLADLRKLQEAIRSLYTRATSKEFHNLLTAQLHSDYPHLAPTRIEGAASNYLTILGQELSQVSDEIRQKLVALATLDIRDIFQELYKKFSNARRLATFIETGKFSTLIDERTKNFVGRDFIFSAIDDLTKDVSFPSGYIMISGEPGIGKTAFIAELVKRKGYVHHFNLSLQNVRTARDFLYNICAQLIVRYELDYDAIPPDSAESSSFLSQLLSEVIAKEKNRPIIILVDALDEVDDIGIAPGANILYLPPSIPNGIYFVVTTREVQDYHLVVDQQKDIYLRDDDPQNLGDVRKYVMNFIEQNLDYMYLRIQAWEVTLDEFVDIITEKSEGNFMYLVHVLNHIREGRLNKDNLDNVRQLPKGLKGYYQRNWRLMRSRDEVQFDKYQEPVICILAAVREPVSIDQIAEWTKLDPRRIRDVINEWRQFLNQHDSENELRYRIYHASFQDFLNEEVGLAKYHRAIAMTALRKVPGFFDNETRK